MLEALKRPVRLLSSILRERRKRKARSPKWAALEREFKKRNPECAACGQIGWLQVHHIIPVSNDPSLELEPTNLVVLCMGKNECHLRIGHGGFFQRYNPQLEDTLDSIRDGFLTLTEAAEKAKQIRED